MMKYTENQIMNLPKDDFISMKNKKIKVTLKDKRQYVGILKNLIEASISDPPSLIASIILENKKIEIVQIESIELI